MWKNSNIVYVENRKFFPKNKPKRKAHLETYKTISIRSALS